MKVALSFLSNHDDFERTMEKINKSNADFIHVDVADGIFVNNVTPFDRKKLEILKKSKKSKDVHLMTLHVKQFIDVFSYIKPNYITYSFEATTEHNKIIKYIQEKNCKVGIAISPFTKIEEIIPYIKKINLVLIMAIIPGYGGQKFLKETKERIKELIQLKEKYKVDFLINVDGGINKESIKDLSDTLVDMIVAGSYVCNSGDFNEKIKILKNKGNS